MTCNMLIGRKTQLTDSLTSTVRRLHLFGHIKDHLHAHSADINRLPAVWQCHRGRPRTDVALYWRTRPSTTNLDPARCGNEHRTITVLNGFKLQRWLCPVKGTPTDDDGSGEDDDDDETDDLFLDCASSWNRSKLFISSLIQSDQVFLRRPPLSCPQPPSTFSCAYLFTYLYLGKPISACQTILGFTATRDHWSGGGDNNQASETHASAPDRRKK